MVLDTSTREYFDGKFSEVHRRITGNDKAVAALKQEVTDLKGNGYFVRPAQCNKLHKALVDKFDTFRTSMIRWQGIIVGGLIVIGIILPYIIPALISSLSK